jgi:diaminopimelate decarboxylase
VIGWLRDTWAELIYLQRRLLELQMQASLRIAPEPSEREELERAGPYDRLGLAPDNQRIELLGAWVAIGSRHA